MNITCQGQRNSPEPFHAAVGTSTKPSDCNSPATRGMQGRLKSKTKARLWVTTPQLSPQVRHGGKGCFVLFFFSGSAEGAKGLQEVRAKGGRGIIIIIMRKNKNYKRINTNNE